MQIHGDQIVKMLKKVAVLREQLDVMCVGKQGPQLSVMDLHHVVQEVYSLKITMLEVDFAAVHLRGKVERYDDSTARVLVRSGVKVTDKRLATVKELCHLALDEKDDWSADGTAMIEAIIEEDRAYVRNANGIESPTSPQLSEALALMAAIELLYPHEYRSEDARKIEASEATVSSIALQHHVPPFVVDQALESEEWLSIVRAKAVQDLGIAA